MSSNGGEPLGDGEFRWRGLRVGVPPKPGPVLFSMIGVLALLWLCQKQTVIRWPWGPLFVLGSAGPLVARFALLWRKGRGAATNGTFDDEGFTCEDNRPLSFRWEEITAIEELPGEMVIHTGPDRPPLIRCPSIFNGGGAQAFRPWLADRLPVGLRIRGEEPYWADLRIVGTVLPFASLSLWQSIQLSLWGLTREDDIFTLTPILLLFSNFALWWGRRLQGAAEAHLASTMACVAILAGIGKAALIPRPALEVQAICLVWIFFRVYLTSRLAR